MVANRHSNNALSSELAMVHDYPGSRTKRPSSSVEDKLKHRQRRSERHAVPIRAV
jgi:hypothetical protein